MEETKTLVTSFEEACQLRGYDPEKCLPEVSMYPAQHQTALIAAAKMFVINEAINEGHQFDWNNFDEKKWFPWFDMELTEDNPSGFRFYVAVLRHTTYSSCRLSAFVSDKSSRRTCRKNVR
jgi:hypothetical protein